MHWWPSSWNSVANSWTASVGQSPLIVNLVGLQQYPAGPQKSHFPPLPLHSNQQSPASPVTTVIQSLQTKKYRLQISKVKYTESFEKKNIILHTFHCIAIFHNIIYNLDLIKIWYIPRFYEVYLLLYMRLIYISNIHTSKKSLFHIFLSPEFW